MPCVKEYPVGTRVLLNGTVRDGSGSVHNLKNHKCYISAISREERPFPVLLGDKYTKSLGWAKWSDLSLDPAPDDH